VGSCLLKIEFERELDRVVVGVDESMSEDVSDREMTSEDSTD